MRIKFLALSLKEQVVPLRKAHDFLKIDIVVKVNTFFVDESDQRISHEQHTLGNLCDTSLAQDGHRMFTCSFFSLNTHIHCQTEQLVWNSFGLVGVIDRSDHNLAGRVINIDVLVEVRVEQEW